MDDKHHHLATPALDQKEEDSKETTAAITVSEHHFTPKRFLPELIVGLSLLVFMSAVWTFGNVYFAKFNLSKANVSTNASDDVLSKFITAQADAYKLPVTYPDGKTKDFSIKEIGLKVNTTTTIAQMRKQQASWAGRLEWWQPIPIKLTTNVDSKAFNEFIKKNIALVVEPPKDAVLSLQNGVTQVSKSAPGKQYSLKNPETVVRSLVESLKVTPVKLESLPIEPTMTTEQLSTAKSKLDKTLQQKIVFTIAGHTIVPGPGDIANWIVVTPKPEGKTVDITVDSGKVLDYINGIASNYVRLPRNQVEAVRSDGTSIVVTPGINGQDVTNKQTVAKNITDNLLSGSGLSLDLPVSNAPFKTVTTKSTDKWIEVDTTNKVMYAYENGALVRTFLVSAGAPATPTVVGKFAIYAKLTSQTMSGFNTDGSRYVQPNVPWVNYFYGSYAIHGNYWRPASWFGNINSSHGCVGVTVADGEWIYDWAPIGTPVIVHT